MVMGQGFQEGSYTNLLYVINLNGFVQFKYTIGIYIM
jgi:hypothetical protein